MFEVQEKPILVERAFIVGIEYPDDEHDQIDLLLDELNDLVETLGIKVCSREIIRIRTPRAKFLLGPGKVREVIQLARKYKCDCIVFDADLSPGQQRNWEHESKTCVIDRQEVILDIFADRAQSKEASLQVDLARMQYSLPRLKRAWTHLSRQRGGGTTQRGEGEAQLELDQRMIRTRITKLKKDIGKIVKQRSLQRKRRQKVSIPTAAIVGYTNAGKSSLLNHLTGASVLIEDKLFATLDPTTRQLTLPSGQKILLTDTVGFIRRLPHHLISSFKATLEEAVVSDFLIHVIDITGPQIDQYRKTTLNVLKELGSDEKQIITVFNKIDLLDSKQRNDIKFNTGIGSYYVSTKTGEGINTLINQMDVFLGDSMSFMELLIPHNRYDLISRLHQMGGIKNEKVAEEGVYIQGNVPRLLVNQFISFKMHPINGISNRINGEHIDYKNKPH